MVLPLLIAAAGLSAAGKLVEGITANSAAKARARALEMGAQQARNEAGVAAGMGLQDDDRLAAHGATLAAAGGGGFTGSAMDVLNDLQRQSLFKARSTIYRGEGEAQAKLNEAAVSRAEGHGALLSSAFSAAGSLMSGFAGAAQAKAAASAGSSAGRG